MSESEREMWEAIASQGPPARTGGPYAVGHNMPGYLPESDVWHTRSFEDARTVLLEDVERHADDMAQLEDDETNASTLAEAEEAIAEIRRATGPDTWYVGNLAYWIAEIAEADFEEGTG